MNRHTTHWSHLGPDAVRHRGVAAGCGECRNARETARNGALSDAGAKNARGAGRGRENEGETL